MSADVGKEKSLVKPENSRRMENLGKSSVGMDAG